MKRIAQFAVLITALCLPVSLAALPSASAANEDGTREWKAKWISKQECQSETNSWLCFRKNVEIKDIPESLTAYISADTKYWLWINGKMVVFEGGLKRGPFPGDGYYDELDIAPYLRKGTNSIAALVWYFGRNGFSHLSSGIAAFIFEATAPGIEILSDNSWEASVNHAYMSTDEPHPNIRLPESNIRYDARKEFTEWNLGGYPKRIGGAMELGFEPGRPPLGRLYRRHIPLWKDYGLKTYEKQWRNGDTIFCALPYNAQITPYLKVEAPEGQTIHMSTDQEEVGKHKTRSVRAEYVTKKGVQEYENYGWMNGHVVRYVIPKDVKVLDLKYRETGYDCEITGEFSCDDRMLNTFWKKAQRTLYVCAREVWMDCPDRERSLWIGDAANDLGEAYYMFSPSHKLLTDKCLHELINWQQKDGSFGAPVPGNYGKELPMQVLAFVGWYGMYNHYMQSGDGSFIPLVYDRLHRYLHETWKLDEEGMPVYRKGDWDWPDAGENKDREAQLPGWYVLALKAESEFAKYLGKDADAAENEKIISVIKDGYNRIYWTGEAYRHPDYQLETDDRANALAVLAGLADKDKYPALIKILSTQMYASCFMEKYIEEALFVMDANKEAIARMKKRLPETMTDDCSTLYEDFDRSNSNNHAWTGGPAILFAEKICGVRCLEPGYQSFAIEPHMGSMKNACISFDTVKGRVSVSLKRRSSARAELRFTVPEGSRAIVEGKSFGPGSHITTVKCN